MNEMRVKKENFKEDNEDAHTHRQGERVKNEDRKTKIDKDAKRGKLTYAHRPQATNEAHTPPVDAAKSASFTIAATVFLFV